ncbi:MAG: hypothetical protein HYZ11_15210 [Candidatus Tectomicrobia bacterium]|uniref:Uncharacterized protein n=1 Tax=Tectimicrobiota bacterium TaxID=2528274 RepID=A0A932MPL0_UNCTE|nr:hypothetical protein [Candidatus Tectomicrobia bacterium]
MSRNQWMEALPRVAIAFGVMAFGVALGAAMVSGVGLGLALWRAAVGAAIFTVLGGFLSYLLLLFLAEK